MENKTVLFEKENHIAIITFNRPEKKNCLNQDLLTNFFNGLDEVTQNKDIHAAIITGSGNAFSTGLDLKALTTENIADPRGDGKDAFILMQSCPKPLIGAINGFTMTGGFEIALNCDFLIASEDAAFADTHVKVGIHPGWGMSQLLQRFIGQPRAKQMSFTGDFIDAQTAYQWGLVNEVVSAANLLPRAKEIAHKMAAHSQPMLQTLKNLIEKGGDTSLSKGLEMERQGFFDFVKQTGKLK